MLNRLPIVTVVLVCATCVFSVSPLAQTSAPSPTRPRQRNR